VLGDRGYDQDKYRRLVWDLGVKPVIARRGTEHGSGLGTQHPRSLPHPRMRTHLLATPEPIPIWSFQTARDAGEILLDRRTAVRGALPLCEEVVRPQRTAKEKGKELRAPCHS
jgi:hypothetical protein